jgi:hypothetical protein
MPIDGIGKPPSIPPPGGTPATSGTGAARGDDFRVGTAAAPGIAGSDLVRLERGEIGLEAYLDARVGAATKHLEGRLARAELDYVRRTLRAELESDPVLVELVRRATGRTPGASDA